MKFTPRPLIWVVALAALVVPVGAAMTSPLLAWRDPVYITAGFAGIVAFSLFFLQPLLIGGYLPGLSAYRGRRVHLWTGGAIVVAVLVHVVGLWITSPSDVIDALLFASPTPFSVWGVIAMWALFAVAVLVLFRRRIRPRIWRIVHTTLASLIVAGTVVHAILIEGTMELVSKTALCLLVVLATMKVVSDLRVSTRRSTLR